MDFASAALNEILTGDANRVSSLLKNYIKALQDNPQFQENEGQTREELAKAIIDTLCSNVEEVPYIGEAVETIRFLSRDKHVVSQVLITKQAKNLLLNLAQLPANRGMSLMSHDSQELELNASKCLSNVIYLSMDATELCKNASFIKALVQKSYSHKNHTPNQNAVTLKLLFLVSALNPVGRKMITDEFDGRKSVLSFLQYVLQNSKSTSKELNEEETTLCIELLRVLFNLNMDLRRAKIYAEKEIEELNVTMECCRNILLSSSSNPALTEGLHCSAGNAIYSIPPSCMSIEKLLLSVPNTDGNEISMKPVMVLVDILRRKVMNSEIATEVLQPILALLSDLCRCSSLIRRHLKDLILPPRKDFRHRPEEGLTFRNKLIKLFTHTNTSVKHGVADFLFVLCKENVDRFVKYTGYGNAAGLLATRGLLAGGRGETVYSDTDSDSDTEEYKVASSKINPVTGHVPPPVRNPLEGMTEEQKEYLAAQLACDISKLSSSDSVIQPMGIAADGSLIPLQQKVHEMKLREERDSD